jgi:hypothetical protein
MLEDHINKRLTPAGVSSQYVFIYIANASKFERSELLKHFDGCRPPLLFDKKRLLPSDDITSPPRVAEGDIVKFSAEIFSIQSNTAKGRTFAFTGMMGGSSFDYTLSFTNHSWRISSISQGPFD